MAALSAFVVANSVRLRRFGAPAAHRRWTQSPDAGPAGIGGAEVPVGGWGALAVHFAKLAIWRLASGGTVCAPMQTINVPIQFRSSG